MIAMMTNPDINNNSISIQEIKEYLDANYDIDPNEKEDFYKEVDLLEKRSYQKTQDVLEEILPQAFAVMKETARRFAENEEVVVTATDHDRELAVKRESVTIVDDKAIYKNTWKSRWCLKRHCIVNDSSTE